MVHTLLLVVLGLGLIGWLSAIFEQLGLRSVFLSRILAAICVSLAAWTHSWIRICIAAAAGTLYLMIRRDWIRHIERKASQDAKQ